MKIFLDDDPIRDSWVDDTWTIVRSPWECLNLLTHAEPGEIEVLSLDHDLAAFDPEGRDRTGYWVLCKVEWMLATYPKTFGPKLPQRFEIHSANGVGRKNMQAAINSIERMRNG